MEFRILTSVRWRPVAEAHQHHLVSRWGASVDVICIGGESMGEEHADAMLQEWSTLRVDSDLETRFNDPERVMRWLAATVEHDDPRGSAPYVILGCQGESKAVLVGEIRKVAALAGLPMGSSPWPTLTGLEVSETGFVVRSGPELSELSTTILESLLSEGVADRVRVHSLSSEHPAFDTLRHWDRVGARGWSEPKIRWRARLLDPETGERVDMHSGKTRANLRKADRRFVKAFEGDAALVCVTQPEQVDDFVQAATSIIEKTYQASLGIGVQDTEAYRALLLEMAEAGALRGYVMRARGAPVAYVVGDRWGTTFSLWGTSFLPEHRKMAPGIVTLRRVMDSLASEGVANFDFGWGHAEYKKKLGDHHTEEADFSLYAKRPAPTLSFMAARTSKAVKARADQAITELGLRDRLKKAWRKQLAKS
jgi:hypothetical protein